MSTNRAFEVSMIKQIVNRLEKGDLDGLTYPNGKKKVELKKTRVGKNKKQYLVFYNEDGRVQCKSEMKKGKMHGQYSEYHENGKIYKIEFYRSNVLTGLRSVYYPDGSLKSTVTMYNDKKSGLQKDFCSCGELTMTTEYKNGLRNGKCTYGLHPDVNTVVELYVDDVLHGKTKEYCSCGALIRVQEYDNGVLINDYFTEHVVNVQEVH